MLDPTRISRPRRLGQQAFLEGDDWDVVDQLERKPKRRKLTAREGSQIMPDVSGEQGGLGGVGVAPRSVDAR